ncbi:hypothetical protein B0O99DRAFT_691531 [Bisporella sp. PMI_857]|nr:hypothetical protein B0O99DRAFT_691531 [Bisporella sp. PMI_857]
MDPTLFKHLPPEVRNMIYALLLFDPLPVPISSRSTWRLAERHQIFHHLSLLSTLFTNHASLTAEAHEYLYSQNTFWVGTGTNSLSNGPNIKGLVNFCQNVEGRYLKCVRKLDVTMYLRLKMYEQGVWEEGLQDLKDVGTISLLSDLLIQYFTGVKRLKIGSWQGYSDVVRKPSITGDLSRCAIFGAVSTLLERKELDNILVEAGDGNHFEAAALAACLQRKNHGVQLTLTRNGSRLVQPDCACIICRWLGTDMNDGGGSLNL